MAPGESYFFCLHSSVQVEYAIVYYCGLELDGPMEDSVVPFSLFEDCVYLDPPKP